MRLLVWNTHALPGQPDADRDAVRTVLRNYGADAMALQEVWTERAHHFLSDGFPAYRTTQWAKTRWWVPWAKTPTGLAFYAREKWREKKVWRFGSVRQTSLPKGDFVVVRGVQIMRRGAVTLLNAHLDAGGEPADWNARAHQVGEIIRKARKIRGTLLLVGDLNLRPAKRKPDALLLDQLCRELGLRVAAVAHDELDYVLVRGAGVQGGPVDGHGASDHEPLLVEVT